MDELITQMTEIYKLMASDEFAESIAKMLWNIYIKSVQQGFSQDQAMQITLSFAKSQSGK